MFHCNQSECQDTMKETVVSLHEVEEARMRPDYSNGVRLGMHTARGLHKVRMVTITLAWRLLSALAYSSACR